MGVLFAFALSLLLTARGRRGGAAVRALGKLVVLSGLILLAPVIGFYHAWWAVTSVSALHVFASELTTYGHGYEPPQFWHDVPLGIRIVVFLVLSLVLLRGRWARPPRPPSRAGRRGSRSPCRRACCRRRGRRPRSGAGRAPRQADGRRRGRTVVANVRSPSQPSAGGMPPMSGWRSTCPVSSARRTHSSGVTIR